MTSSTTDSIVAVIGAGPAGLMAAELLANGGVPVHVFDSMPSAGRKFLLAGKGGLNLTHSEPFEQFLSHYGERQKQVGAWLREFGPDEVRRWAEGLGVETFVGSSKRVFPAGMGAAPLLRAWIHRLKQGGVVFHFRHRWTGWDESGTFQFETSSGKTTLQPAATILALGGASWPETGSTGAWVSILRERGIPVVPLKPANCGFNVGWSGHFRSRFAGAPVKTVVASFQGSLGQTFLQQGEFVITETGVEGNLIYACSALLRDEIEANGRAILHLDLLPDFTLGQVLQKLDRPRGSRSVSTHLEKTVGIQGVKAGLLWECLRASESGDSSRLARLLKDLPLGLTSPRPIDEAISSAGGVSFEALNERLMLKALPGVFCAGEMLDWEAPTGGYLLTACFASGRVAGHAALEFLNTI